MEGVTNIFIYMYKIENNGEEWRKKDEGEIMMTEQENRSCIVCGNEETQGIFIFDSFVCQRCEQEIVTTDASEDKYRFFIRQMRSIWLKQNA